MTVYTFFFPTVFTSVSRFVRGALTTPAQVLFPRLELEGALLSWNLYLAWIFVNTWRGWLAKSDLIPVLTKTGTRYAFLFGAKKKIEKGKKKIKKEKRRRSMCFVSATVYLVIVLSKPCQQIRP